MLKFEFHTNNNLKKNLSSDQDGGVNTNPSLPHTTKRRITTNVKLINNQKCQKIKLHGTPTIKELKKQSTRPTKPVGGRLANGRPKNPWQGSKPSGRGWQKGKLRLRADCGLQQGLQRWEKLPVSQEGLLESGTRAQQASCILPSLAPPSQTAPQHSKEGCPALVNP